MAKRIVHVLSGFSLALLLAACQSPAPDTVAGAGQPPVAQKIPSVREYHGLLLHDDYLWLKDEGYPEVDDPEILAYLEAENRWFEQQMAPLQPAVDTLFNEMKARLEPEQEAVPWEDGEYIYRWRYTAESQYRLWERRPVAGGDYVTILDESAEARGHEFFSLSGLQISPDGRRMAWAADFDGAERSTLYVDDLDTGRRIDDGLHSIDGSLVWASDNRTLFYLPIEEEGWYRLRVKSHIVGTAVADDRELFVNPDRSLFLGISRSQSRQYLFITLEDRDSSEQRVMRLDDADALPRLVSPRQAGRYYEMDHGNGRFYIRTNDQNVNLRIATAPEKTPGPEHWQTLLPPSDEVYYQGLALFDDFIAVEEMSEGLKRIRIREHSGREFHVPFPEQVYTASLGDNPQMSADFLRISYESMVTPNSVYDYRPADDTLTLRQRRQVPSGYDSTAYLSERLWTVARDGARVPVTLVYHRDTPRDGSAPLYLYGYGAYGLGMNPWFSTARLSLLDRGVIFAIAHVRGGDEMGFQWYLDGKLNKRSNTFNDFVDVANDLAARNYTRAGHIAINGGSAGGELIGAAVIQAPQLWAAAILDVPFVDVLNTMLDETLPLTPPEWIEWGNPIIDPEAFKLIRSYSPYDNISARDYPPMLVTGGINDPRVTYWEPAKWTAKMRALKTDDNPLLMKINMGAGHQGPSGRYNSLYEVAESYAFALYHLGVELN
ncbi:MAG: S9 family peptidase [Halieaceae bacterium]|jgi:oligopeptidase B|nr:S9 family peptidase [Halieaceae bacterium]